MIPVNHAHNADHYAQLYDEFRWHVPVEFNIADVIRRPVSIAAGIVGQAEAAPVRCDHMPVALQVIDDELERG